MYVRLKEQQAEVQKRNSLPTLLACFFMSPRSSQIQYAEKLLQVSVWKWCWKDIAYPGLDSTNQTNWINSNNFLPLKQAWNDETDELTGAPQMPVLVLETSWLWPACPIELNLLSGWTSVARSVYLRSHALIKLAFVFFLLSLQKMYSQ